VTDVARQPVVLLTGAAGQLGTAITDALVGRGAALVLVDRATVPTDGTSAGSTLVLTADVTAAGAPEMAIERCLDRFGRLDAVINNAGVEGPIGRLEDLPDADLRSLFEVNLFALMRWCGAAIRHFRDQGTGRIVNMASGAGLQGTGHMAAYSASKHAVVGLTRSVAKETADAGISVNAVCPGCVESPMMGRIEARLGELAGTDPVSFLPAIPAGRYGRPGEIAELTAWLALEAPAYITGAAMPIDGGLGA
jgi:NAD(P)-dependent dehydrogenase (short-subunit alcohol dehydrogenase family)